MGGGDLTSLVGVGAGTNFGTMGAGTTIVVVASDLYEEAPIWYLRVKQAAQRGATLIVANPRETKLDRFASLSPIRYEYGEEVKTIQDLTKKGKASEAFLKAENAVILFGSEGLGLEGSTALATACARALNDSNHVGRPNNGLIGVWQRGNDQGAWEIGFRPEENLVNTLKGKAVYVIGADPAGDDPALAKALEGAEFVAVQDMFETETAKLADVVLPAQAYTEREGTFISGERRLQRFYPAVPALEGTKADFAITSQVAKQMGVILEGTSAQVVFEIMAADMPVFAGLSYAKLAEVREQWPIVGRGDVYYGGTTYENKDGLGVHLLNAAGRGEKVTLPRVQKVEGLRLKENKLLAVPVTKLYDRGVTVASAKLLTQRIGAAFVALNPSAAESLGVQAGERVKLSLDGVSEDVLVKIDDSISEGVALVPRSMGLPISEPTEASVKSARKVAVR
jgi:NADH-quinone oxidoreductase subunit G